MDYITTDSDLTGIANAIRSKTYRQNPISYPSGFVSEINSIEAPGMPEKDVNFIDYDGTVVYTYTKDEFASLSALPSVPTHTGLTSQGWNWTLSDAKGYVASHGGLIIAPNYITSDGSTRFYITVDSLENPTMRIYFYPYGSVWSIDWGDGTTTSDGGTGTIHRDHTYSATGDYVITFSGQYGYRSFGYPNNGISGNGVSACIYCDKIKRVELGNVIGLEKSLFDNCLNLESITIPSSCIVEGSQRLINIDEGTFRKCYALKAVAFPPGITEIKTDMFSNAENIKYISIPKGVTTIAANAFFRAGFEHLYLPDEVTSIGSTAIKQCQYLKEIEIPSGTQTISYELFRECVRLRKIIIPEGVTTIGGYCLSYTRGIYDLTIPSTVTTVSSNGLSYCYGVRKFHFLSTTPPTAGSTPLAGISGAIIYVPRSENQAVLNAYKTATNWSTYASYMQEEPA